MRFTSKLLAFVAGFIIVVGFALALNACGRGARNGSMQPSSAVPTVRTEADTVATTSALASGDGPTESSATTPTDGVSVMETKPHSSGTESTPSSGATEAVQTEVQPRLTPESTATENSPVGAPNAPQGRPTTVESEQPDGLQRRPGDETGTGTVTVGRRRISKDDFPLTTLPIEPGEKVILITIDDGPGEYTVELLELLKKEDVKVVFFLNGDTVPWYKNVVRREYEEGHTIGTHTYCHRSFYQLEKRASREEVLQTMRRDMVRTEENIKAILPDIDIKLLRMPEGYYRKWMEPLLDEFGYICVNWTAGYDWLTEPDEKVIEYYKRALKPGGIYLFHDGKYRGKRTIKILSEFIPYARSQGYRIADPKEFFGG